MKVGIVSLGCAKNLVDSEMVLSLFSNSGFDITPSPEEADVIVINTCGFINDAKKESIDNIFDILKYHKKVVVIGCLVERYKEELQKEIPEVDLWISIKEYPHMKEEINSLFSKEEVKVELNPFSRILSTPFYQAYLRISEGCNNCCTYCAIPLIRGSFRSRSLADLVKEAKDLASKGIKELVVISQDTTRYGSDFSDGTTIVTLLKELLKIKEFEFIRLLYLYPDEISDDLLYLIRDNPRLTKYLDIPIQHCSSPALKAMNRRGDKEFLYNLFAKIKTIIPDVTLRTTLITGFPGETEEEHQELLSFIKEIKFDHLGVFKYSPEEGTKSSLFPNQIDEKVKEKRYKEIMKVASKVSYEQNKKRIGQISRCIVTKANRDGTYLVRGDFNAPDEVDGNIIVTSSKVLEVSSIVEVKITSCYIYDLFGEIIS